MDIFAFSAGVNSFITKLLKGSCILVKQRGALPIKGKRMQTFEDYKEFQIAWDLEEDLATLTFHFIRAHAAQMTWRNLYVSCFLWLPVPFVWLTYWLMPAIAFFPIKKYKMLKSYQSLSVISNYLAEVTNFSGSVLL